MADPFPHPLGALPTPPDKLARAWPIDLLMAPPTALDPRPEFHSPLCPGTVDQWPKGSCVAASGSYVQSGQEALDEGRVLRVGTIDFQATYMRVKAETGDPNDSSPGLWPPQLWDSVKARGWITTDGVYRPISGYYSLGRAWDGDPFIALLQGVIATLGPTQISCAWDSAWWTTDAAGYLYPPTGNIVGGHAVAYCGWTTRDARVHPMGHQTWGHWGHNPHPDHFYIDPSYWDAWSECWHVSDKIDAPRPEGAVVPALDKTSRLLSIPVGTQFYAIDTNAPLVKLGGTKPARVYSPCKVTSTQYAVVISTGGIQQEARVNAADVTIIATSALT